MQYVIHCSTVCHQKYVHYSIQFSQKQYWQWDAGGDLTLSSPVFDEVSVVILKYGDIGDDSLDLQMNYVLAIYGESISEQDNTGVAGFHSKFPKYGLRCLMSDIIDVWCHMDSWLQYFHIKGLKVNIDDIRDLHILA